MSEAKLGLLLVAPAVLLMVIVAAYPVLSAFRLSMYRYNIETPNDTKFVGFDNYTRIFASGHVWEALMTTVTFTALSVSIEFVLGMALALVMNRALGWLTGIVRVAVLIPWATVTIVTALAWKWIFTPSLTLGSLRGVYAAFAPDGCVLCSHWSSLFAMVLADVWKTAPFIALLLLAGLQSIDAEMYEAADVDGARPVTKFLKITLPSLKSAVLVALLFRTLDAFRMFDLSYVMTGGANKTETISTLAYTHMIRRLDMGLGSAISVLIFFMVLAIAFTFTKVLGADLKNVEAH
ncbi:MAG: sugar ABC transporter permease [Thermoleophilia bacterium]|nr:sugar ABC transporter permease [Thermoleophilia bacterium]